MDRGLEVVEGVEVVGWYRKYLTCRWEVGGT